MNRTGIACGLLLSSISPFAPHTMAQAQPAPAPAGGANDEQGLAEIVVTAERRAESAQRSALSIQALDAETLVRANVTKPEDLGKLAAGVNVTNGGATPQVFIRGVGNFAANSLAEGAVAFNLDGVYISRGPSARGMFYDLERVEILKGPQGTLYGRNATGGAINVISAKPRLGELSGFAELQGGNYSHVQGTAALNLPVGNSAALRISGQTIDHDGYLEDGYLDDETRAGRLQFLWEPMSDLSLLLHGNYQNVGGKGTSISPVPPLGNDAWRGGVDPAVQAIIQGQPGLGPLLFYPKDDGFMDMDLYAVAGELNWQLDFANLTFIPAYRRTEFRDLSYAPGFPVTHAELTDQFSTEVRLAGNSDRLEWVFGGYFFDERHHSPDGEPEQFVQGGVSTAIYSSLHWTTESYAAFGQATYSVTDTLRLTGGLRYSDERKTYVGPFENYGLPLQAPAPPGTCIAPAFFDITSPYPPRFCHLVINAAQATQRLAADNVTYRAGVEYDLAPRSLAYANFSTGFKSGGFYLSPSPNTFKPEKVTAYDVGVKNRFLDNRLQLNLEAFYWAYRDKQESSVGPTSIAGYSTLLTYNADKAKSYGADVDIVFLATPADELNFKLQYNPTEYTDFTFVNPTSVTGPPNTGCSVGPVQAAGQVVDCSGKPLMRAAEWSGTAGYSHMFDLNGSGQLEARASVQFSSSYFLSTDFLGTSKQGWNSTGDFDLTYTSEQRTFVVSAFVHNIWNEAVFTQAFHYPYVTPANTLIGPDGLNLGSLQPPRTYGARIRFNF